MKPTFTYVLVLCLCVTAATAQNSSPYWSTSGNSNAAGTSLLGTTNPISLHIFTNNVQRVYIDSANGRIGIGTATPQDRVHINSSQGENAFRAQINGVTRLMVHSNGGVAIGANTVPPPSGGLYVLSNVGIGTPTPQALLDVNGDAHINGRINGITVGRGAGNDSTNIIVGSQSFTANTLGENDIAIGNQALHTNTWGQNTIAIGNQALYTNSTGGQSVAIGNNALYSNTGGGNNVAIGLNALFSNIGGTDNTAINNFALYSNTFGYINTAVGESSMYFNTTGYNNTAVGDNSLESNGSGYANTGLGVHADLELADQYNSTAIGFSAVSNASNKVVIGNTSVTVIGGQVGWSVLSDGRFKKDIQQNVPGLSFINKLKPVTYHTELQKFEKFLGKNDSLLQTRKQDLVKGEQVLHTGFVAQDVEAAAKEIKYEFDGVNHPQHEKDNYSLVYSNFVPSLVKAVQELSKQNDSLKNELAAMHNDIDALKTAILAGSNPSQSGNTKVILSSGALLQNVPNPFANTTTINYTLPGNYTNASVIITDKVGRTLKTVSLNGGQSGSILVEASTLAAGAYQYSLIVNGRLVDTKQMLLAR